MLFSLVAIEGISQSFFDAIIDGKKIIRKRVKASSATTFYTDDGNFNISDMDSIKLYYYPSESLIEKLNQLDKFYEIYRISESDLPEFEKGGNVKADYDWIVYANEDTIFGYIEIKGLKIHYNNQFGTNPKKYIFHDARAYKKGSSIFENHAGVKELIISGEISLYSEKRTGYHPNFGPNTYYVFYVRRKSESNLSHFVTPGIGAKGKLKSNAAIYFQNCPSLIQKIENDELGVTDLEDIITYYNTNCTE